MKNKNKLPHCHIATLLQKYHVHDIILLISHVIKREKEFVFSHPEYKLSFYEYLKLRYYVYLRKKGYSLAYITKRKEFYGLDFYINKNVLVPRPETEMMVDEVVGNEEWGMGNEILLIDVGTGSGCIPISILKQLNTTTNRQVNTYAIDISHKALRVAKKNAKKHDVNIKFLHGNLLSPLLNHSSFLIPHSSNIIITANLPYLTSNQLKNEPSIQREPKTALISDNQDGLKLYDKLLSQINYLVICYMFHVICYIEIDPSQSNKIKTLVNKYLPQAKITIKKDLAGLDRLVCLDLSTPHN